MDPRVERHAEIVVEHSTSVEPGDRVVINSGEGAEDLVVALYEKFGDVGALPVTFAPPGRAARAYARAIDEDDLALPEHQRALLEATDVVVTIRADANVNEMSDVPPEKTATRARVFEPISDLIMETRWCITQHPAPGNAQVAEMSTPAYAEFVYDAVNKDWDAQREFQQQLVEILDPAEEVRIVAGETTDVTMSVAGNVAVNDYGETNLPGGEVFTAPVPASVEGEVLFDKPLIAQGREITDAHLVFEGGEVVEHAAATNEDVLTSVLETDDGARRLGELGIGMNRDIDRFTYNMLFDEKMGDTVHMALGRAIDESVGEDGAGNESAVHMDMIVDVSEDSSIEVDGEVVQRDGTFVFENLEPERRTK